MAKKKKDVKPVSLERETTSLTFSKKLDVAVEDICQFHRYLDTITLRSDYDLCKRLYGKMQSISEKYPSSKSLKNKLDEAETYIWPHGRIKL